MLTLCGETFEPMWTDFGSGVTRTAAWRQAVNPMGEIPVLEEDGKKLTQTAPILLRLAQRYGEFQGAGEAARYEVLRWLFWDNQKLSGFMAACRYRRAFTPAPNPAVLDFMRDRVDDYLSIVERRFQYHPFIVGDYPTIADLSMTAYLAFPKHEASYDLAVSHPAVNAWLKRVAALPGWMSPYDLLPGNTCIATCEP